MPVLCEGTRGMTRQRGIVQVSRKENYFDSRLMRRFVVNDPEAISRLFT
jgi:hypothetical protein